MGSFLKNYIICFTFYSLVADAFFQLTLFVYGRFTIAF